jgi:branched-chain amino acid transport system substrate-binding protein
MKHINLTFYLPVAAALLASALVLPTPASAKGITFGVMTPLTETNAVQGQDILNGIKLAVNRVNKGYDVPMKDGSTQKIGPGLLGGKITLKVEDSESRPQSAMAAIHKLINVDRVPVVLGAYASGVTVPTGQYANKHKTVDISAGATSPKLRDIGPYFFNTIGLDTLMGKALAQFAIKDSGTKKFVSLVANNPFGVGIEVTSCKQVKAEGGECVTKLRYHMHKNNYRPIVQSLKKHLKKGEGVLFTAYGTESRLILKEAYQMGLQNKKDWYADYPTMWSNEISKIPQIGDGIKGVKPASISDIYKKDYAKPYKKAYNKSPMTAFGAFAYDSAMLAALAVEKADSTDPKAIAKALHEVSQNYEGVSGNVAFDKDGMRKSAQYAKKIYKDSKLQDYKMK